MKATYFFLLIIFLSSCSWFQDKDELLKKDIWILESRFSMDYTDGEHNNIMEYFSESEEEIILEFNLLHWDWQKKGKWLIIYNGQLTGEFSISDLTRNKLTLSFIDNSEIYNNNIKTVLYTFRHPGYKDWVRDDLIEFTRQENNRSKK